MSENRRRRNNGAQNRQVKKARTNNARRILLLVGLMSLVAVISIGGTIAWLTDSTETITNTFTSSNIDITLEESENLDLKMVPGNDITKDPKVTVATGSEDCWLFVKLEKSTNYGDFLKDYVIADGWIQLTKVVDGVETNVDGVYYRTVTTEQMGTQIPVLKDNKVTVLESVTKTQMDNLKNGTVDKPTLKITAYACQKDNVSTAADAWAKLNPAPVTP